MRCLRPMCFILALIISPFVWFSLWLTFPQEGTLKNFYQELFDYYRSGKPFGPLDG